MMSWTIWPVIIIMVLVGDVEVSTSIATVQVRLGWILSPPSLPCPVNECTVNGIRAKVKTPLNNFPQQRPTNFPCNSRGWAWVSGWFIHAYKYVSRVRAKRRVRRGERESISILSLTQFPWASQHPKQRVTNKVSTTAELIAKLRRREVEDDAWPHVC